MNPVSSSKGGLAPQYLALSLHQLVNPPKTAILLVYSVYESTCLCCGG